MDELILHLLRPAHHGALQTSSTASRNPQPNPRPGLARPALAAAMPAVLTSCRRRPAHAERALAEEPAYGSTPRWPRAAAPSLWLAGRPGPSPPSVMQPPWTEREHVMDKKTKVEDALIYGIATERD